MFYKINPKLEQVAFDLAPEGFLTGDRLWIDVKGYFRAGDTTGPITEDKWQNAAFQFLVGSELSKEFDDPASLPVLAKAKSTTLVVNNHDDPLSDNSDPNHDYGVRVKLAAFTQDNDTFYFRGRAALPEVQGSIYNAGGGNDVVIMPDTPVAGFDTSKMFYAGSGNDRIKAGDLDLRINFGQGVDTFVLDNGTVEWGNKENRDNDNKIVVKTDGGRHQVMNVEVLKDADGKDLGVKWYFDLARDNDGGLKVKFFENGKLVASGDGYYDEALPTPSGKFEATIRKSGWVEISGVSGYGDVAIHKGYSGGNAEADFVVAPSFLKTVFNHIGDAYGSINKKIPWDHGRLDTFVPVTAAVRGEIDQPLLKPKGVVTDDRGDSLVNPKFVLWNDGDHPGLESKSIQIFFTVGGSATRFDDWNFAGGVHREGKDANGDVVYSVMLEQGKASVAVPIRIIGDKVNEGTERIKFDVVDIDIWRHTGSSDKLYHISGGPGADQERDFDGPTGLESNLIQDTDFVVTIHDHLIG